MKGHRARYNFQKEAKKAKSGMMHGLALELRATIKRFQLISLVWGFSEITVIVMENSLAKDEAAV